MPRATLSVSVPEATWIHDASRAHPETEFRVRTVLAGREAGIALVELTSEDLLSVVSDVADGADVAAADLLWQQDTEALVQVETTSPPLIGPVWRAGVPIELPFAVRDGTATWEVRTSADRLSALGEHLDAAGICYAVEAVREFDESPATAVLTDRQREVLLAALERGYYRTPRDATLSEVAADLGIAKATCSELLHRAEGSLIEWFAGEYLAV